MKMRKNFITSCIPQVNFSRDIRRQSVAFGGKKLKSSGDIRWQFSGVTETISGIRRLSVALRDNQRQKNKIFTSAEK